MALLEPMEARRLLANIVVNTLADETVANATTSLREAAAIATSSDVIVFQPGLSGQITLGGSPIVMTETVSINGPGAGTISVSGNNASRVFEIAHSFVNHHIVGLTLKSGRADRGGAIHFSGGGELTLTNVFLSGNTAAAANGGDSVADGGGAFGGAIYADGDSKVVLNGGALSDNLAVGGTGGYAFEASEGSQYGAGGDAFGGAIYGTAEINGTTFANNTARGGAGLAFTVGGAGGNAYGGAIAGGVIASNATFTGNQALGGDAGDGDFDSNVGGSASGGAIYLADGGLVSLNNATLTSNSATGGAGGSVTEALAHYAGGDARGGAIAADPSESESPGLIVNRSTLSNNAASGGIGGADAGGGAIASSFRLTVHDSTFTSNRAAGTASLVNQQRGGFASGGAISSGWTIITGSAFARNSAVGGKGANADASRGREIPAAAGGEARGGAIAVFAATGTGEGPAAPTITRSTLFGNSVQGGEGGWGYDAITWPSGDGGYARGGGIFAPGSLDITALTIAGNAANGGLKGAMGEGGSNGWSQGGGLAVIGTRTVKLANTIVATNTGGNDISGIVNSLGFNLIGKTTTTNWVATDKTGTGSAPLDPKLAALTNNGGPTQTMLPLAGSPAIDAGKSFGLALDQRGLPRTSDQASVANAAGGDGTDIGAVEVQSSSTPTQTPFKTFTIGNAPITIQAEDFDNGGEGVAYHDVDAANQGGKYRATGVDIAAATTTGVGFQVGWTRAGEWLEYTVNVQAAGTYNITFGLASNGAGGKFHLEVDGVDKTGPLTVPNSGGWYTTATITKPGVVLGTGTHVLRLKMDANGATGYVGNFNYFTITKAASTTVTTLNTDTAAHVRDGSFASTNYGNAASLEVKKSTTGYNREAYLKFNLASVASISAAKLRIFGGMHLAASIQLGVHGSSNTGWTESGLTWNNRNPAATGASALSSATISGTAAKWYELDVTAYLKAEKLAGRSTVTLVLRSATHTEAIATFAADGAINAPHLMVTS